MEIGEVDIPTETSSSREKIEYTRRDAIISDIVKNYREWPQTYQIINSFKVSARSERAQSGPVADLFPAAAKYRQLDKSDRQHLFEELNRGVRVYETHTLAGKLPEQQTHDSYINTAAAHDILVSANLGLVVKVLDELSPSDKNRQDLAQLGAMGLVKSVRLFDSSKNIQFSTYATYWIKQSIQRGKEWTNVMRISQDVSRQHNRIQKAIEDLTKQLRRQPTIDEIYENVKGFNTSYRPLRREDVLVHINNVQPAMRPRSLNERLYGYDDDSNIELVDEVADPNSPDPLKLLEAEQDSKIRHKEIINRLIGNVALTPAEALVATLIVNGMNDDDIARELEQPKATILRKKGSIVKKMQIYVTKQSVELPGNGVIYDAA